MGRKKVDKQIEKVEQVAVGGNVTLQIKQGKRVIKSLNIHNSATLNLFYSLALSLTSHQELDALPNFICAGTGTSNDPTHDYALTGLISPINMIMPSITAINSAQRGTNKATITFQAVIPYLSIGSTTIIRELGLYGVSNPSSNTMVARVELPVNEQIELSKGQSLYILWTFSIQGVTQNVNN